MAGFHHLDEFYAVNSSCNYINQVSDQFRSAEEDAFFGPCETIVHFRVVVNLFMKTRIISKQLRNGLFWEIVDPDGCC